MQSIKSVLRIATVGGAVQSARLGLPSFWKFVGFGTPVLFAGAVATSEDPMATIQMCRNVPLRLSRDVIAAALIVTDYKMSLQGLSGEALEDAKHACHQRAANRLLDVCFKNGGIYIKLGQHIGQLDHLLPEEYVHTMRSHMLDRCPVSSPAEVRRIITDDLGQPPEQLFQLFDYTPIASASLAQVHVATSHSGEKLAVKVQHEGLRETSAADIATIETLVSAVRWLFRDFDYMWLVEETKQNLPKELDFKHEAQNAERCRRNLSSPRSHMVGRVVLPEIYIPLTSHRVLTMEFVDGMKVTDKVALLKAGISPRQVARVVSETFNEMIFTHGYVHCDPHAANMLVKKVGPSSWQLVLLDHGLYQTIDDNLRRDYAGLWRALVFGDADAIKRHSASMCAGDAYQLFASMLTTRPWDDITRQSTDHLHIPRTRHDKQRLQSYAQQYAKEINSLLLNMPRPLLLLLKTNDCLRAVDVELGQPVNTFSILARECTRALAEARAANHPGLISALVTLEEQVQVELRVAALHLLTWFHSFKAALCTWIPTWRGGRSTAAATVG